VKARTSLTTLNVRGIDSAVVAAIKRAAHARDLTIGEYLGRLVELHRLIGEAIEANSYAADAVGDIITKLRLETVRT